MASYTDSAKPRDGPLSNLRIHSTNKELNHTQARVARDMAVLQAAVALVQSGMLKRLHLNAQSKHNTETNPTHYGDP